MSEVQAGERELTITWEDPLELAVKGAGLSGLEAMRMVASGEIPPPPMARLLGMDIAELEEGRVVFAAEPGEHHYNPIGVVHGGLAATLIDSATGCAVHTTLPAGVAYTTLEVKANYVRPITADTGRILAEARVIHRGGTVATAEARVTSERDGKLLAHGTSTCLIIDRRRASRNGKPA